MKNYFDNMGIIFTSPYSDWEGNQIERTPDKYPYSYDPYVIRKKSDEYKHAVYSDRLVQWDYDKYNKLCEKHFKNKSQYWDERNDTTIEAFLRDYYDNPKIEFIGLMKGCNYSSGYPYWILMYND